MLEVRFVIYRAGEIYEHSQVMKAVPRKNDLIRTARVAAARVTDVAWNLETGEVTVSAA
jgi:hypothetical protein